MSHKPVHIETLGAFCLRVSGRSVTYGRKAPVRAPFPMPKSLAPSGPNATAPPRCARSP
jgi:hypothetical protein